jgi:hypothetical protein
MATFNVKVVVEFEYEVEADNEADAEQAGWQWEDFRQFGVVDSIETDEVEEDEDEVEGDLNDETDDEYALASAGHGNDEDY